MRLLILHLENFRQHADSRIEFPPAGIAGFIGQNESGKSTILEGILYALYGTRATRGKVATLRWNRAPARQVAAVTLLFEVAGRRYEIYRSETQARLKSDTGHVAEGITAVDQEVPELLGMTLEEFRSTVIASQKDLARIQSMGGVEKRQLVLSVMGVGEIDGALAACREAKNGLRSEVQGLREGLGDRVPLEDELQGACAAKAEADEAVRALRDEAAARRGEETEAEAAFTGLAHDQGAHDGLVRERRDTRIKLADARERLSRQTAEMERAEDGRRQLDASEDPSAALADARAQRDGLRDAKNAERERAVYLDLLDDAQTDAQAASRGLQELEDEAEDLFRAETEGALALAETAEAELGRIRTMRTTSRTSALLHAEALEREARDVLAELTELEALGSSGRCPTCHQALGSALERVCDEARQLAASKQAEAEALRETARGLEVASEEEQAAALRFEEAQAAAAKAGEATRRRREIEAETERLAGELEKAQRRAEEARAKLGELPEARFDPEALEAAEAEIARLERAQEDRRRAEAIAARLPDLEAERARIEAHEVDLVAALAAAGAAIEALGFDPEAFAAAEKALREARERRQEAAEALARAETRAEALAGRVGRARAALEAYDARAGTLRDAEADLQAHVAADERLAAFRTAMAATIRPDLEVLTGGFLSALTDGRHQAVELSEDFDVLVQEDGGPVEVISGGAEDVTAIALRLAISQLIAERAGHPLSLLVLDEPFGSLDPVRRQNVVELIRRLRGVFAQVLLVSHVEEVQEAVDVTFLVAFDPVAGRSSVERVGAAVQAVA